MWMIVAFSGWMVLEKLSKSLRRSWKVGRCEGTAFQHFNIISYSSLGQFSGFGSLSPCKTACMTWLFPFSIQGTLEKQIKQTESVFRTWAMEKNKTKKKNKLLVPFERISHMHTPKLNTSLLKVMLCCWSTSGAAHRMGIVDSEWGL